MHRLHQVLLGNLEYFDSYPDKTVGWGLRGHPVPLTVKAYSRASKPDIQEFSSSIRREIIYESEK